MNFTVASSERLANFMYRVYALMALALSVTGITAYYVAVTPALFKGIHGNAWAFIGIILCQFALVAILTFMLPKMSLATATLVFFVYAISLGLTFSLIFFQYTFTSISSTFFITAGMFGIMAIYGYVTKADLTSLGNIAMMGLFGIIIAMFVNIFVKSGAFNLIISAIGVVIFTILTAYDSQKIKQIGMQMMAERELISKVALLGALTLYLDFLNLFLFILQFTGQRRSE